eukprot:4324008-Alexandrium_andersonii.AAC.1
MWDAPGASLRAVSIDVMHTRDLGVYSELCGSLLWSFVYDSYLEGDAQKKLDLVWARIRALYDDLR